MNITMSDQDFIERGEVYVNCLLKGICEHPFEIAVDSKPHAIRFVAKLHEKDFEAIKYSDLYLSIAKIIDRIGNIRRDLNGQPYNAEFKLFDPYFEGLVYREIPDPSDIWA